MKAFFDRFSGFGLKSILVVYLLIAVLVGIGRHREDGSPNPGTIASIIEGTAWPITLLIDAVQRK